MAEGTKHLKGLEGERVVVSFSMGPLYAMLKGAEGSMAIVRFEGEAEDQKVVGWRVMSEEAAKAQGEDA